MNISADFGITVTDTLRKNKDKIVHKMELSSQDIDHDRVRSLFSEINFESNKGFLAVTGGRHLELGDFIDSMPIVHVNEIEAIGEGTMSLSGLNEKESTIIVSAGSGTACIHAHMGKYTHCSGTGVGGGTVLGLSKLLLGTSDPIEIAALAEKGSESEVDLILEDVVSGPIGQLPSTTTAVNFGKVSKMDREYAREDIAAATPKPWLPYANKQIGIPILPVFGKIIGGSSILRSLFKIKSSIKPTIEKPPIIIKA